MSLPLKEIRIGIPEEVHIFLDAEAAATKRDKIEIAREILIEWTRIRSHAFKVATDRFRANRITPE